MPPITLIFFLCSLLPIASAFRSSQATMGKKRGNTSSGATASVLKPILDWKSSTISKRDENKMRSLGLIPSAESDFIHPGFVSRPKPPRGFTVMFHA
jgi:hypothetical protein